MDRRDFARLVKEEAIDAVVRDTLNHLNSPRIPNPASQSTDLIQTSMAAFFDKVAIEQQRRATWFRQLNVEQQSILVEILRDCAELSAFNFCCLIDGVGGKYEGTFEISAVDSIGKRTVL